MTNALGILGLTSMDELKTKCIYFSPFLDFLAASPKEMLLDLGWDKVFLIVLNTHKIHYHNHW